MMTDDLHLNSDFVAFNKAQKDAGFVLFKVYTRPLKDTKTGETGQFHFDCSMPLELFEARPDPVAFLKYMVRKYLLHGKMKTGVPLENWLVEFSPVMGRYNGVPSHLFLDTARDRNWLV